MKAASLAVVLLSLNAVAFAAPDSPNKTGAEALVLEDRCVEMYSKGAGTPPDAVLGPFKYAGRDARDRHLVKGSATIQGKEHQVQCAFDAEPAPAPTDRKK